MSLKLSKPSENFSYLGYKIYVGLDVHKKKWSVNVQVEGQEYKSYVQDPRPSILVNYLHKNFPDGEYHCAYEAGFCGFWIYEELEAAGIKCLVIHPADVPTTDKERRQKRDKVDARKIARSLANGSLVGIHPPSKFQQSFRSLVRTRLNLQRDITRIKNRIKCHLHFFGKEIESKWPGRNWSGKFLAYLSEIEFREPTAKYSLEVWIKNLEGLTLQLKQLDQHLLRLSKEASWAGQMELLLSVPGIGQVSGLILLSEIGEISRFKQLDQLCGYIGLIPEVKASGETEHMGSMTKRGNSFLRYILIEAAWRAIRHDPALQLKYQELIKRMKAQQAIVRIARKLLNRIRFVLKNGVLYQKNQVK